MYKTQIKNMFRLLLKQAVKKSLSSQGILYIKYYVLKRVNT